MSLQRWLSRPSCFSSASCSWCFWSSSRSFTAGTSSSLKSQARHGESTTIPTILSFFPFPSVTENSFHCASLWRLRPAWVTLILVTGLQHVTAKFAFIKKEAGTRDLNNRYVYSSSLVGMQFNLFFKLDILIICNWIFFTFVLHNLKCSAIKN